MKTSQKYGRLWRAGSSNNVFDINLGAVPLLHVRAVGISLAFYGVVWLIVGDWMVMDYADLWMPDANISEAFSRVWFIFLWAVGINIIFSLSKSYSNHRPIDIFLWGAWLSVNAGIFEEILYRWLRFFIAMAVVVFFNIVTFGFLEWLYVELLIPLANFTTFGALEAQLIGASSWVLGAAVISANGKFTDAHGYQGYFGLINSWFMGMVFFWVMFNYGLVAAMIVHGAYNIAIFTTVAAVSIFLPKRNKYRYR